MTKLTETIARLLISSALITTMGGAAAYAQENAAAEAAQNALILGDVVVTATRQSNTVNRVPLSISALPQAALDQQGIKSVADLQRSVPALTVTGVTGGVATFSIRGIVAGTGATTPTTGVYIDDVPLQKRFTAGSQQNNGTPSPPLFDLERIEVLRGPQGTLFGGSSMGGTIRFIQPQPSLVRYSANVRAEVSDTRYGGLSYEGGVAFGGPIIQDKLGFRFTAFNRHTGGYIDLVDPYNPSSVRFKDANSANNSSYRLALAARLTDRLRTTLAVYQARTAVSDTNDSYQVPLNRTLTTPSYCYNVPAATTLLASPNPAPIACPATAVPGRTVNNVYMRSSETYGPFPFRPFENFANRAKSFAVTNFHASSLTMDYDFPTMSVKSVTSYIEDQTSSAPFEVISINNVVGYATRNGDFYAPGSTVAFNGATANVTGGGILFRAYPDFAGIFRTKNNRWGLIQELRFSSPANARPLSWVGGIYYSNIRGNSHQEIPQDYDRIAQTLFGVADTSQRYGERRALQAGQTCASLGLPAGTRTLNVSGACLVGIGVLPGSISSLRDQRLKDTEIAAFGEANYAVTDALKLTAGVRFSRVGLAYQQTYSGPNAGWLVPTVANTGITSGNTVESPITPKVGVQYQLSENNMLYANAAKGYRAGGINAPLPEAVCGPGLALGGLTVADAPTEFGSDGVWSYEAGGKFRLANRLQVNASLFRIDWSQVQLTVQIPGCGNTFIQNAGTARSEGVDLQVQGRLVGGLSTNFAFGYTNARYTEMGAGPAPKTGAPATAVVNKGDKMAVPEWTTTLGLQYDFMLFGDNRAYVRGDWQHASEYFGGLGPGVNAYAPDTRVRAPTDQVNARAGIALGKFDASVFVNNLLDSRDPLSVAGGRSGCVPNTDAACTTFGTFSPFTAISTFRPRTVGLQLNYRY